MKCFYHAADLDGQCSGAIVRRMYPECEMIGIDYGDEFPWDKVGEKERVWMVDFCLQPFADMEALDAQADLVWIDHHEQAIKAAREAGVFMAGVREVGKAGCELTWEFLRPGAPMAPIAVRLLGRYDVWDHADPDVLPFQWGMRLEGDTGPGWDGWRSLLTLGPRVEIQHIIGRGRVALEYQQQLSRRICRTTAFETRFGGLAVVASNSPMCNSQHFESVYDPARHDAMVTFFRRGDGLWSVHLYADKPGVDVGAVAAAMGGGGHRGAAGFQCRELPGKLLVA